MVVKIKKQFLLDLNPFARGSIYIEEPKTNFFFNCVLREEVGEKRTKRKQKGVEGPCELNIATHFGRINLSY